MEMYHKNGPNSCMIDKGQSREWSFLVDIGKHPVTTYSYMPWISGVIMYKGTDW